MKKVLFATTALIATAGIASAEVSISGWAEIGIEKASADNIGTGGGAIAATAAIDESKTRFFQDYNVKFSMSGTTDGGITFGANVELTDVKGANGTDDDNGTDAYLKTAFGNFTLGNTDGAMDWAMTEVAIGGSIADDNTAHGGYNGDYGDGEYDGQILRYDNSFGDFGFAVSAELNDAPGARANGFAIGAKYGMDMGGTKVDFGAGYQTFVQGAAGATWRTGWAAGDRINVSGISAGANFNGIIAKAEYTMFNNSTTANVNVKHTGIGLGYKMDALTLGANWGRFDAAAPAANVVNNDVQGFGVTADYDLGGGAIVQAGYGSTARYQSDGATAGGVKQTGNAYSIGLRLNF
jgi:outer membrane protein OmpU